jgi:hypothetical protein
MENQQAPLGYVWQCAGCGRISEWLYGFNAEGLYYSPAGHRYAHVDWDASCSMHATLVRVEAYTCIANRQPTQEA